MLKWKYNEEPNGTLTLWTCDLGNIYMFIEKQYLAIWLKNEKRPNSFLFEAEFETTELAKEKAEQWLKDFFMPTVKHTVAEVVGTEVFNGNKLEEKASDVLDAILETISENNYIENEQKESATAERNNS